MSGSPAKEAWRGATKKQGVCAATKGGPPKKAWDNHKEKSPRRDGKCGRAEQAESPAKPNMHRAAIAGSQHAQTLRPVREQYLSKGRPLAAGAGRYTGREWGERGGKTQGGEGLRGAACERSGGWMTGSMVRVWGGCFVGFLGGCLVWWGFVLFVLSVFWWRRPGGEGKGEGLHKERGGGRKKKGRPITRRQNTPGGNVESDETRRKGFASTSRRPGREIKDRQR